VHGINLSEIGEVFKLLASWKQSGKVLSDHHRAANYRRQNQNTLSTLPFIA